MSRDIQFGIAKRGIHTDIAGNPTTSICMFKVQRYEKAQPIDALLFVASELKLAVQRDFTL